MQVEAERVAWEIAKAEGLPLCTILPSYVMGPVLSPSQGGVSVDWMKASDRLKMYLAMREHAGASKAENEAGIILQ